jgi:mannan endo-1,4-beta-mannosidase
VVRGDGTRNVTWMWTISHSPNGRVLGAYWPGPSYVTWVGIDGYFERPADTYDSIFGSAVAAVRTFTTKPVLLSEVGVGPDTGKQAHDITALFAGVRQQRLLGLVWFDVDQHAGVVHQDWRLEGNPPALAAFRRGASAFDLARPIAP